MSEELVSLKPEEAVEKLQDQREGNAGHTSDYVREDESAAPLKDEHEAYDELQTRKREDAESEAHQRSQAEQTRQVEDLGRNAAHSAVQSELPAAKQAYQAAYMDFARRVQKLGEITDENVRRTTHAELQREAQQLGQRAQQIAAADQVAKHAVGRDYLAKAFPEIIADKKAKAEFVEWAAHRYGLTREQVLSVTDVNKVAHAAREYRQVLAAKPPKAKPIFKSAGQASVYGGATRGAGASRDLKDAHRNLKRSGSIHDALEIMTLERIAS